MKERSVFSFSHTLGCNSIEREQCGKLKDAGRRWDRILNTHREGNDEWVRSTGRQIVSLYKQGTVHKFHC